MTEGNWIKRMESRFFVGRQQEKSLFLDFLNQENNEQKVLNLYGTGGIGKSFLLDEYARIAEANDVPFLLLDSSDFAHTPHKLCEKISSLLPVPDIEPLIQSVDYCLERLNRIAAKQRFVIAIDTYEELHSLDSWLRDEFVARTTPSIQFILSGRRPLQGAWVTSPAWRSLVKSLPVPHFDQDASKAYGERYGIKDEATLLRLYELTLGHPLTLSLSVGLTFGGPQAAGANPANDEPERLFRELTYRWLREVPDDSLRDLVEAASLVRSFNQELLQWMIGSSVSSKDFRKLVELSFIRSSKTGYRIHALLRTSLSREIRTHTPERFNRLRKRSIAYYHHQIVNPSSEGEMTDVIANLQYGLEDSVLLSTFLGEAPDGEYEYETVQESNLHIVNQYIQDVSKLDTSYERNYFNSMTGQHLQMSIPSQHDRIAFGQLDPSKFIQFGPDTIRMIKNRNNETIGLAVFIPIHRESLPYLQQLPASSPYFSLLGEEQLTELRMPPDKPAGVFIYHVDLRKDDSISARAALMRLLLSLLLNQGVLLFSSPLAYHQEITKRMGFSPVEGATHYAFGQDNPSPTFVLDLRGPNHRIYFDRWVQSAGLTVTPNLHEDLYELTPTEREVAQLVLSTESIQEIADQLSVTHVAIKKHLGRIYKKTGVSGKSQLIKKLMERQKHV
ncbi:LuxR C-terminal-related transcriptional regulator [Paenibacillus sp. GCM10027627]|uniref:LuxR C-terminal-related transcriptional regulator n=1 Tax=unclassified Paenibacillus TaxID=185978 RepID=UPI00362F95CA